MVQITKKSMTNIVQNAYNDPTLPKNAASQSSNNTESLSHTSSITVCEISIVQAIQNYRPAVFWSVMVCMCTVMEGYDTALIPNFFAHPSFAQKYGSFDAKSGTYQLSAFWQAALGNSASIGSFLGIIANGYLSSWFGSKRILLGSLLVLSCFIAITFVAPNVLVLFFGELLCGIPWGIFATTAPAYSSEILPLILRGYLTAFTNMCFIIGQLIAAGILDIFLSEKSSWSYRSAFVFQWVWPALIFPVLLFMPESPWHFVRLGELDKARKSLERLQSKFAEYDVNETLEVIINTNTMEKQLSSGTSYLDCFRGTERRRTEIACMAFAGQMLSGLSFTFNSTYFYQQIGFSAKESYKLNLGGAGIAFFATLFSWFLIMPYVGHRKNYLFGMITMTSILIMIGSLSFKASQKSIGVAQIALVLLWVFTFQTSAGPLGWAIPAEIGSTRLRQKTICIARNSYHIFELVAKIIEPYFMNPTELNLKGYTAFIWSCTALMTSIWTFFRLPETKYRTYKEIDILFANKVPARQFASYKITNQTSIQENTEDVLIS